MTSYLLALLLRLSAPAYHAESIAYAIVQSGASWSEATALVHLAHTESRFALRVIENRCRPRECDRGRSRGIWQVNKRAATKHEWATLGKGGLYAQVVGARAALRIWRAGLKRCGGKLACARARYRGTSVVSGADRAFARRVLGMRVQLERSAGDES